METVCKENAKISAQVRDFIKHVETVGEESITDYLLWKWRVLNKKFNYLKTITKYTKEEENKRSGADFELELWILSDKSNFSIVFQAKKLLKEHNNYRQKLNYKCKNKTKQIVVLKRYCEPYTNKLPFYIFYSNPDKCTKIKCIQTPIEPTLIENQALFITDAYTVEELINNNDLRRLSRTDILNETCFFTCLFCCPLLEVDINDFLTRYFPKLLENNPDLDFNKNNNIPAYVEKISKNKHKNVLISELPENVKIRNIGVLDLRTKNIQKT